MNSSLSQEDTKLFKSREEITKFYQQLKFDVKSEDYEIFDKQKINPPTCSFCDSTKEIVGVKVNDNERKTQVIASICEEHNKMMRELPQRDIELPEVQNMIRFLFPKGGETIIRYAYMHKTMKRYDNPLYMEYWAGIKLTAEELLLGLVMDAKKPEDTEGYTKVTATDKKCVLCEELSCDTFQIFSSIKECWLEFQTCEKCTKILKLDLQDMTYELRTLYFEKYEDIEELPKRSAFERLSKAICENVKKIYFLDPRFDIDKIGRALALIGVNKENSLIFTKEELEAKNKPEDETEEKIKTE